MFAEIYTSLKECSYDSSGDKYLVENKSICVNFDKIMEKYCSKYKSSYNLTSNDALIETDNEAYFIEFKNEDLSTKDGFLLMEKARNSIHYVLVYSESKNQTDSIESQIKFLSFKPFEIFENKFKSNYFKMVKFIRSGLFDDYLELVKNNSK